jgi:tetratricopeptide (TPR) repeat protein
MRRIWLVVLALQATAVAYGKEYGHYDTAKIVAVAQAANGEYSAKVNFVLLDQILGDLSLHNDSYPSQFDSQEDRQRATKDVLVISRTLDAFLRAPTQNRQLLLRAALLDSIGHNLGVPDAGDKALAAFAGLLSQAPNDARANYLYGKFLVSTGKPGEAIPMLEKAKRLGVSDAGYSLGLAYSSIGLREKAVETLREYAKHAPKDTNVAKVIDSIRDGNIDLEPAEKPRGR